MEIPGFNELVKKYGHNKKVRFIAISHGHPETLIAFLNKTKYDFEQLLSTETSKKILIVPVPRNIICAQDKTIIYDRVVGSAEKHKEIEIVNESLVKGSKIYIIPPELSENINSKFEKQL